MAALLTYRSRDSFEVRFGRNVPDPARHKDINDPQRSPSPGTVENEHWAIHNDGNKNAASPKRRPSPESSSGSNSESMDPEFTGSRGPSVSKNRTPTYFSAQSYLRYQGEKFIQRFDANCYIAITRKLDTHDVGRNRGGPPDDEISPSEHLRRALSEIEQPTLVLGIQSDGLFTFAEQEQLAAAIPRATLRTIDSSEGHDAFLLEFEQVNAHLLEFMRANLADIMAREPDREAVAALARGKAGTKASVGEVDDITAW
jgi:homoserine O-acetyltransferase